MNNIEYLVQARHAISKWQVSPDKFNVSARKSVVEYCEITNKAYRMFKLALLFIWPRFYKQTSLLSSQFFKYLCT